MTIFLKIIRDYLTTELTDYQGTSSAADKSLVNRFSQALSGGREAKLSAKKRAIAGQLIHTLNNLNPSTLSSTITELSDKSGLEKEEELNESSAKVDTSNIESISKAVPKLNKSVQDKSIANYIIELLNSAKKEAKEISDELNYDEGTFGPLISDSLAVINQFLKKLAEMQLQDIPNDSDPYNKFCYHLATYLFKNILAELHSGFLDKITSNPKITSFRELTKVKEKLIKEGVMRCKEQLEELDKHHHRYLQARKDHVILNIQELQRKNAEEVNKYGVNFKIPITVAFFSTLNINAPKLGPEAGKLNDCLTRAEIDITREDVDHNIEKLSTASLTNC
ncbi:hypothetical protein ACNVED_14560 [Legionella sp. D16C41]|uniref:hypothetical protein n=1 Tax=Legionella sp. D16C41 TaxID=3402688 RepID=UPI003AF57201